MFEFFLFLFLSGIFVLLTRIVKELDLIRSRLWQIDAVNNDN